MGGQREKGVKSGLGQLTGSVCVCVCVQNALVTQSSIDKQDRCP